MNYTDKPAVTQHFRHFLGYHAAPRHATIQRMTRYLLRVYSDAGYYPDRALLSYSRGRAERHAKQLEREGFRTTLLVASSPMQLSAGNVPGGSGLSAQSKANPATAS